ncbi:MAG: dihydroneopterin aldolase [Clostridiales bacterium]|nr:dihydroneopterin aldolase [Candidatus Scatonaster coprocaballi]
MDRITLQNMSFRSHSGVLPEEKEQGQNFVVTLNLDIPEIPACKTDKLDDTVNYARVFEITRDYVENVSCDLIEYMAHEIILRVMREFEMIACMTCEIKKPTPPIDGQYDSMNVTIARSRIQMEDLL